jgi:xanthine phosphoribosyltransferase
MIQDFSKSESLSISWDRLHRDTLLLADKLKDKGPFRGIIAVARGGLVPAAILATALEIRLLDTICMASYDERVQRAGEPIVLKPAAAGDGEGWLVVDELTDSGNTFRKLRTMLPKAHFAAVYVKPAAEALVDSMAVEVAQAVWMVFPWDQEPAQPL